MKKIILPVLAIIILAVTFNSCTMEKRHYLEGYYIDRNNHKEVAVNSPGKQAVAIENSVVTENKPETTPVIVSQPIGNTVASQQPAIVKKNNTVSKKAFTKQVSAFMANNVTASKHESVRSGELNAHRYATTKNAGGGGETDTVLLVILAILLPPLAVYLYEGSWTKRCTINLILTLLCGIPGMIHALIVVLS
jgi:uncharacterized membrane protein YqaE (UPF0057 family)